MVIDHSPNALRVWSPGGLSLGVTEGCGWITNKTIRNMFDLDVQQATQIPNDLRATNVVVKDPDGPQRGPAIRWLPAKRSKYAGAPEA